MNIRSVQQSVQKGLTHGGPTRDRFRYEIEQLFGLDIPVIRHHFDWVAVWCDGMSCFAELRKEFGRELVRSTSRKPFIANQHEVRLFVPGQKRVPVAARPRGKVN